MSEIIRQRVLDRAARTHNIRNKEDLSDRYEQELLRLYYENRLTPRVSE